MKKNYISNSQESVRMFKSDLLEALSKVHFLVPVFIFVPVILFCAYKALFDVNIKWFTFFELFLFGVFVWTLVEYIMHRFVFHYAPPDKPWAQRMHFIF
ncbi:MAG: fatty acid hydroxylase, partial [Mucilaginibacter sp.]